MRSLLFATAACLALAGPALAQRGGEGNNTGCNGQGNSNSPCQPGQGGGTGHGRPQTVHNGGQGGRATATALARTRVDQRVAVTAGGNDRLQAPAAYAPTIASANPCIVGVGAGGSGAGFGFSLGLGLNDRDCTMRATAAALAQLGYRDAAREVMCGNAEVRRAFATTGIPCSADRPRAVFDGSEAPARPAYCNVPGIMNRECQ